MTVFNRSLRRHDYCLYTSVTTGLYLYLCRNVIELLDSPDPDDVVKVESSESKCMCTYNLVYTTYIYFGISVCYRSNVSQGTVGACTRRDSIITWLKT